jgi:CRP-like cAMP-binding protein
VLSEPAPRAYTSAFKESSVEYRIKYWIDDYARAPDIDGQVLSYIWNAFQRHRIEMPFPHRVLQMLKSEDASGAVSKERETIKEGLGRMDFLSVLSPEELQSLADETTIRIYMPGEAVVHQGDKGSELFFILDGDAEVRVGNGPQSVLATLHPLQFFGEMSLLTGEARSATIVAQTRLEVLVLNKENMSNLFNTNPLLVERMSAVLVKRQTELVAHQEQAARRDATKQDDRVHSLGDRIRKFFGLS